MKLMQNANGGKKKKIFLFLFRTIQFSAAHSLQRLVESMEQAPLRSTSFSSERERNKRRAYGAAGPH